MNSYKIRELEIKYNVTILEENHISLVLLSNAIQMMHAFEKWYDYSIHKFFYELDRLDKNILKLNEPLKFFENFFNSEEGKKDKQIYLRKHKLERLIKDERYK